MLNQNPQAGQTDEALMARITGGDHRAFSDLVTRHMPRFYRTAFRMCGHRQDAEDILQGAFLKLWTRRTRWDPDKGARFTTWFYRVLTNHALDHMRKKKPVPAGDMPDRMEDAAAGQDVVLMMSQQQRQLEEAIQALPPRQKTALNLCFYEELSNKEAAEIMQTSVKAVESLLMRAKKTLKNNLVYSDRPGREVQYG